MVLGKLFKGGGDFGRVFGRIGGRLFWCVLAGLEEILGTFFGGKDLLKRNKTKIAITLSDSFCVDRHRSDFIYLLNVSADMVFCNEDELKSLYQIEDIKKAKEFIDDSISCVACTCAERGAYLFHGSSISEISTNKVAVVDTTGAGDSFAAGFLYGLSKNFTFYKCATIGNVVAG